MSKPASAPMSISPALAFLTTAAASMPKGIGDRLYSATMNQFLSSAIECGMVFAKDDALSLRDLQFFTSVGVFEPFGERFYTQACLAGGTYPALWEKHREVKPWKAARRLADEKPGRVAPGVALLIKADDNEKDTGLARIGEYQVWWCTSFTGDRIILGRYKGHPRSRDGQPARRATYGRESWEALQKASA